MNEQHPLRSLVWIPVFGMAAAVGYEALSRKYRIKATAIYFVLILLNMIYFSDVYFRQFPRYFSEYWQYGFKEVALYACQNEDKYENIIVTDTFGSEVPNNTGLPALYVLFYCKIDPKMRLTSDYGFEKIKIRRMVWEKDNFLANSLVVGSFWDLPPEKIYSSAIVKTIKYPNGKGAFVFMETTNK